MVILESLDNPHSIITDVITEAVTQSFEKKVWYCVILEPLLNNYIKVPV